ncbi:beta-L-arabinofuranosidase domain-containing protein [Peribacillus psychrosaccharolyticus]|uniref:glycoside hydrolase family 127 protein n=1 Tax=Peribacillus psychrosaccharolyticus TaxID=1407 RepID=UPI003D2B704F
MKNEVEDAYAQVIKTVVIEDNFWSNFKKVVAEEVIPYQWKALNDQLLGTEPSHAIENFRIAAGESNGTYYGTVFQDSDVAKWLETVAYSLADHPNSELERKADEVISLLGRAQGEDGYLNTYYTLKEPQHRWTNLRDNHELYCAGHLIEAGVAYFETTNKRKLLDIVCKFANLIDSVFGPEPNKIQGYPGHEEIELALIRLFDVTRQQRYLQLAQYFINQRGKNPFYFDDEKERRAKLDTIPSWNDEHVNFGLGYEYQQAHQPVREQKSAVGHAVRAVYLYTAMADLAAKMNDQSLIETCEVLWDDVTKHKMYITAGIGSNVNGESFTSNHDLPNDTMYCETCASVGLVFWANRMLRVDTNSKYADVLERAIYNGTISGMDLDGKKFFYVNPLEVNKYQSKRADQEHVKSRRQTWFSCACCPPNLARMIASIQQNIYTQQNDTIHTHLYIAGEMTTTVAGQVVTLNQEHHYPWNGQIAVDVKLEQTEVFTLSFRIPGWCSEAVVRVNGKAVDVAAYIRKGYIYIEREWRLGDRITLDFAMPVERVSSHPLVSMNVGKVALQRGPIVYCLEETDNGENLAAITLSSKVEFTAAYEKELLGGVVTLNGTAQRIDPKQWQDQLYITGELSLVTCKVKAIPYYAWSNRQKGEMIVWINR